MNHTHEDDRLTVGCPECIRTTRAAEKVARWEQAPLRHVTWTCSYYGSRELAREGMSSELSFTLQVNVPVDADVWELDEHYAEWTGEAFVMSLPDSVSMDDTSYACETFDVSKVDVGELVVLPLPVGVPQPELFAAVTDQVTTATEEP
jgi:hypothetical protein